MTSRSSTPNNLSVEHIKPIRQPTPVSPKPNIEIVTTDRQLTPSKYDTLFSEESSHLNIRFFFNKDKGRTMSKNSNEITKNANEITKEHFKQEDAKKYGRNITWLMGRAFYQPKGNYGDCLSVRTAYRDAFASLVSFQFVIGEKFKLPIFTLGNKELDTKDSSFCNNVANKEFKFIIVDGEQSRNLIADLLLTFHIKSDIGEDGITLICGEILQRAGKGEYRPHKFMLIKFIYNATSNAAKIENFIMSLVKIYSDESLLKYCLMSEESRNKYVEWLTNY